MITSSLIAIVSQAIDINPSINNLLIIYFFFIHFGMLIWLISGVASIAKKKLMIKGDIVKIFCSMIGALTVIPIIWEFLTKFNYSADAREVGLGLLFSNLPAFLLTGVFFDLARSGLSIYIAICYPLFGFIGGWGIGQFLEWMTSKIKR